MKKKIHMIAALLAMLLPTMQVWAGGKGGSTTYYAALKAQVSGNCSGMGKVYAGTSNSAPSASSYKADSSQSSNQSSTTENESKNFYAFASADEGYEFSHWSTSNGGTSASTANPYAVAVKCSSSTESSPTLTTVYAVFKKKTLAAFGIMFETSSAGTYTVDGAAPANKTGLTEATSVVLKSTDANFLNWVVNGTVVNDNPYTATCLSDTTISADFLTADQVTSVTTISELTSALSNTAYKKIIIPSGTSITVAKDSTVTVPSGKQLVVDGTLNVLGTVSNSDTISGNGTLYKVSQLITQGDVKTLYNVKGETLGNVALRSNTGKPAKYRTTTVTSNTPTVSGTTPGCTVSWGALLNGTTAYAITAQNPKAVKVTLNTTACVNEITAITGTITGDIDTNGDYVLLANCNLTGPTVKEGSNNQYTRLDFHGTIDCAGKKLTSNSYQFRYNFTGLFLNGSIDFGSYSCYMQQPHAAFFNCSSVQLKYCKNKGATFYFYDCGSSGSAATISFSYYSNDRTTDYRNAYYYCGVYSYTFSSGNDTDMSHVYAGSYSSDPTAYLYNVDEVEAVYNQTTKYYDVREKREPTYVCVIGTTQYESLTEAVTAAGNGAKIALTAAIDLSGSTLTIPSSKNITISLDKHTVTGGKIVNNGTLTLVDLTDANQGTLGSDIENNGTIDVTYGTYSGNVLLNSGTFTTHGGVFTGTISAPSGVDLKEVANLRGGQFSKDPAAALRSDISAIHWGNPQYYWVGVYPAPIITSTTYSGTDKAWKMDFLSSADLALYQKQTDRSEFSSDADWRRRAELESSIHPYDNYPFDCALIFDRDVSSGSVTFAGKTQMGVSESLDKDVSANTYYPVLAKRIAAEGYTPYTFKRTILEVKSATAGVKNNSTANNGVVCAVEAQLCTQSKNVPGEFDKLYALAQVRYMLGGKKAAIDRGTSRLAYDSLAEAVAAVQNGETVLVGADTDANVTLSKVGTFTIDPYGFNWTGNAVAGDGFFFKSQAEVDSLAVAQGVTSAQAVTYVVAQKVASVGEQFFESLTEAVANANGAVVTLLAATDETITLTAEGQTFTLNKNGIAFDDAKVVTTIENGSVTVASGESGTVYTAVTSIVDASDGHKYNSVTAAIAGVPGNDISVTITANDTETVTLPQGKTLTVTTAAGVTADLTVTPGDGAFIVESAVEGGTKYESKKITVTMAEPQASVEVTKIDNGTESEVTDTEEIYAAVAKMTGNGDVPRTDNTDKLDVLDKITVTPTKIVEEVVDSKTIIRSATFDVVPTYNAGQTLGEGQKLKFRLPVDAAATQLSAIVYHGDAQFGIFAVQTYNNENFIEVESDTFSPYGYELLDGETANPIAAIGTTGYATLPDAITAASNGDTITMLADITITAQQTVSGLTIDLNGKSITTDSGVMAFRFEGNSTLTDSVGTGSLNTRCIDNYGSLVIDGVTYNENGSGGASAIRNFGSSLAISNSTFTVNSQFGITSRAGADDVTIYNTTIQPTAAQKGFVAINSEGRTDTIIEDSTINAWFGYRAYRQGSDASPTATAEGSTVVVKGSVVDIDNSLTGDTNGSAAFATFVDDVTIAIENTAITVTTHDVENAAGSYAFGSHKFNNANACDGLTLTIDEDSAITLSGTHSTLLTAQPSEPDLLSGGNVDFEVEGDTLRSQFEGAGYAMLGVPNKEGWYTVNVAVAQIGADKYATFAEAIAAAEAMSPVPTITVIDATAVQENDGWMFTQDGKTLFRKVAMVVFSTDKYATATTNYYPSAAEAFAAADEFVYTAAGSIRYLNTDVTLLADDTLPGDATTVIEGKKQGGYYDYRSIDLNGHTLVAPKGVAIERVSANVTMKILDSSESKTGSIVNPSTDADAFALRVNSSVSMTMESGSIVAKGAGTALKTIGTGSATLNGGSISADPDGKAINSLDTSSVKMPEDSAIVVTGPLVETAGSIEVKGGSFSSAVPAECMATGYEDAGQTAVVAGYYTVKREVYTITFLDENDNVIISGQLEYNALYSTLPVPAIPVKVSDDPAFYYTGAWAPSASANTRATGNVTHKLTYTQGKYGFQYGDGLYTNTFANAYKAVADGGTVTVLNDAFALTSTTLNLAKNVTVDLNGSTLSMNNTGMLTVSGDGTKVTFANGTIKYGSGTTARDAFVKAASSADVAFKDVVMQGADPYTTAVLASGEGSSATFDGACVISMPSGKQAVTAADGGTVAISGGLYSTEVPVAYCAADYKPADGTVEYDGKNYYTVTLKGVAQIGDTYYDTFAAAIAAANAAVAGGDPDPVIIVLDQTAAQDNLDWKFVTDDSVDPAVTTLVRKVYVAQIGETKYESLAEAVADAQSGDTIELLADDNVSLTNGQEIEINKPLTITGPVDTNGKPLYTIYGTPTNTGYNDVFVASASGTVTISNLAFAEFGNEASQSKNGHAPVFVSSGNNSVVLDNVVISDFNRTGVKINGGEFLIRNCTIDCATAMSNYRMGGVDIANDATGSIVGTTIENVDTSDPTTWVSAALELIGSGDIRVEDCTITSSMYGIFVSTADGTSSGSSAVTVANTAIEADMYSLINDSDAEGAVISVNSGRYSGMLYAETESGLSVSGGIFDDEVAEEYCADGYIPAVYDAASGLYTVKQGVFVAAVYDDTFELVGKYETLYDAVRAAEDGYTVELLADVEESVTIGKSVTLAGEYTITGVTKVDAGATVAMEGVTLDANGQIYALDVAGGATVDMSGVTVGGGIWCNVHLNGGSLTGEGVTMLGDTIAVAADGQSYTYRGETLTDSLWGLDLSQLAGQTLNLPFMDIVRESGADVVDLADTQETPLVQSGSILYVANMPGDTTLTDVTLPARFGSYTLTIDANIAFLGDGSTPTTGWTLGEWNEIMDTGATVLDAIGEDSDEVPIELTLNGDADLGETVFEFRYPNLTIDGDGNAVSGTIKYTDDAGTVENIVLGTEEKPLTLDMTGVTDTIHLGNGVDVANVVVQLTPEQATAGTPVFTWTTGDGTVAPLHESVTVEVAGGDNADLIWDNEMGVAYIGPCEARLTGPNREPIYTSLANAIALAAQSGDTVTLMMDITGFTGTQLIEKSLTLDGAGHTITAAATADGEEMFDVAGDVDVTIADLTLDGAHKYTYCIQAYGSDANLTLNDVTVLHGTKEWFGGFKYGAGVHVNGANLTVGGNFTAFSGGKTDESFPFTGILYSGGTIRFEDGATASIANPEDAADTDLLLVGMLGALDVSDPADKAEVEAMLAGMNIPAGFYPYTLKINPDEWNGSFEQNTSFTGASPLGWNDIIDYGKEIMTAISMDTAETPVEVGLLTDTILPDTFVFEDSNFTVNGNGNALSGTIEYTDDAGVVENIVLGTSENPLTLDMTGVSEPVEIGSDVAIGSVTVKLTPEQATAGTPVIIWDAEHGVDAPENEAGVTVVLVDETTGQPTGDTADLIWDDEMGMAYIGPCEARLTGLTHDKPIYTSLANAIELAAQSGDTITLLMDIVESPTISKSLTLNGGYTLTGVTKVTGGAKVAISNVMFDAAGNLYALDIAGGAAVAVTNATFGGGIWCNVHLNGGSLTGEGVTMLGDTIAVAADGQSYTYRGETLTDSLWGLDLSQLAGQTLNLPFMDIVRESGADVVDLADTQETPLVQSGSILYVANMPGDATLTDVTLPARFASYTLTIDANIGFLGDGTTPTTGWTLGEWNEIIDTGSAVLDAIGEDSAAVPVTLTLNDDVTVIPGTFVFRNENLTVDGDGHALAGTIEYTDNAGILTDVALGTEETPLVLDLTGVTDPVQLGDNIDIENVEVVLTPEQAQTGHVIFQWDDDVTPPTGTDDVIVHVAGSDEPVELIWDEVEDIAYVGPGVDLDSYAGISEDTAKLISTWIHIYSNQRYFMEEAEFAAGNTIPETKGVSAYIFNDKTLVADESVDYQLGVSAIQSDSATQIRVKIRLLVKGVPFNGKINGVINLLGKETVAGDYAPLDGQKKSGVTFTNGDSEELTFTVPSAYQVFNPVITLE